MLNPIICWIKVLFSNILERSFVFWVDSVYFVIRKFSLTSTNVCLTCIQRFYFKIQSLENLEKSNIIMESITSENAQIFKCYATEICGNGEQSLEKVITFKTGMLQLTIEYIPNQKFLKIKLFLQCILWFWSDATIEIFRIEWKNTCMHIVQNL